MMPKSTALHHERIAAPLVLALHAHAEPLAGRIAGAIGGQAVIAPEGPAQVLRDAFASGQAIVGICAAGILIRAIAPLLADKRREPPVIAVSPDGAHVVPLLGGHNGANALARRIAEATGGTAAITTAGDAQFGLALDEPPSGWVLANPADAKAFMAALLNGAAAAPSTSSSSPRKRESNARSNKHPGERTGAMDARLRGHDDVGGLPDGATVALNDDTGQAHWLRDSALPFSDDDAPLRITCTQRPLAGDETHLVFHPRQVVLGVGMARHASAVELADLVEQALAEAGLAPGAVAAIGTVARKADEPALDALCKRLDAPLRLFAARELRDVSVPNPSDVVAREVGTPSVAEAAALALAGKNGELLLQKRKSANCTVAIARLPIPLTDVATLPGRPRGRLRIVGIGPGDAALRTGQAREALLRATDWVGYRLYLDLASDLAAGKRLHVFDLGEEEERARHAIRLAAQGREVALLASGDAAIYAMAAPLLEVLTRKEEGWDDFARRIAVEVIPGVTALQAASAASGALIGHDFCAISLSDLMTPWDVIRRRVEAAARGDFVIAFYNPRSRRRTRQLVEALDILRAHRHATTPVLFASNVARPEERLRITTLAKARAEDADMLSIVLVGNSESRVVEVNGQPALLTPRGYGNRSSVS